MAVVINKESGLAENLPDASGALRSSTHEVAMYNPQGEFVSVPYEQASDALQQGYTQPNSQQLAEIHKQGKYGTTEQQLKTFAEGAASATTFGASTAIERGLGVNPKDIQGRAEVNPVSKGAGEAAGLVGSLLTGVGEGALLGRAAEAVVPAMGEAFAGRIGSAAAKGAIENMIFQGGDEASKMFSSDPNQSVETALTHVGLAGLLGAGVGGGFGVASEAWKATAGKRLENLMSTINRRTGGVSAELKENAGVNVPPELSAALGNDPNAQRMFQTLQESNSSAGTKAQEMLKQFHVDANEAAAGTLGKTSEDIDSIYSNSDYDTGKSMKDMLTKKMSEIVEPISKKYSEFESKFKSAPLSEDLKANIANQVSSKIEELGLNKAASDVQLKAANKLLEVLPKQENVHDLKLLATNLTEEHPFGSDTYRVGKMLKGIINDAKDTAISDTMGSKAPELLGDYKATQGQYKEVKNLIDDLNDRLHVGKSYGPDSFIKNIREAAPEDIIRRLSPKGDVELQNMLEKIFPEVSQAVKANELNKIIKSSLTNGELNTKKLFNNIDKLSPEMRNYVLPPEQLQKLDAIRQLVDKVPKKMNTSGTARTLDKLWNYMPASAAGIASMLLGHNPAAGVIIGHVGQSLSREVPDAIRLAMLKFLGSSAEISSEGMGAMVKLASATIKGEKLLMSGTKNVLGTGGKVIPMPSSKAMSVLEEQVKKVADQDPKQQERMLAIGGKAGHYMPDHAAALAMTASRNLQYLASLKPVDKSVSPLEPDPVPDSTQQAKYQRALQIAQQPLIVLNAVKDGSLTLEDRQHLETMYPALHERMSQKLFNEMSSKNANLKSLPYDTKMGISSFLGTPLDASMSQQSIMSTQTRQPASQQPQKPNSQPSVKNADKLDKVPGAYATPQQSRQMQRAAGK